MDLSTIPQPETREVELLNPATDSGTGLVLIVATTFDRRVKASARKLQDLVNDKNKDSKSADIDESELDRQRMAAHVLDWRWEKEANWKGKKPKFDQLVMMEILKQPAFYSQLQYEIYNIKSFYGA